MGKKQILRVEEHYKVCCCLVTKFCPNILQTRGLEPARLLCPRGFPGKNTGVGCLFPLQEIFPIQGLNPCLLYWQVDSLPLSHQGSPQAPCRVICIGHVPLFVCVPTHSPHRLDDYYMSRALLVTRATKVNKDPDR